MNKKLTDLVVGDFVCTSNRYHGYFKGKITRFTKTQMVVKFGTFERKHNRESGYPVGSDTYDHRVEPLTPEIVVKMKRQKIKDSIGTMLLGYDFKDKDVTDDNEKHFIAMEKALKTIMEK